MKPCILALMTTLFTVFGPGTWLDDEPPGDKTKSAAVEKSTGGETPEGLKKLFPSSDIWLDAKRKAVVVDGQVCLREGQLEMFACPKGTKEHESIIAIDCLPEEVHAGLLAVGAKVGTPVKFDPEY